MAKLIEKSLWEKKAELNALGLWELVLTNVKEYFIQEELEAKLYAFLEENKTEGVFPFDETGNIDFDNLYFKNECTEEALALIKEKITLEEWEAWEAWEKAYHKRENIEKLLYAVKYGNDFLIFTREAKGILDLKF